MTTLLVDIEAFLKAHPEVAPTRFGDQALGDRHFVRQLRAGRRVWPETEVKVRAFMEGYTDAPPPFPAPTNGTDLPAPGTISTSLEKLPSQKPVHLKPSIGSANGSTTSSRVSRASSGTSTTDARAAVEVQAA